MNDENIIINVKNEGYGIEQCSKTMTVADLKELLNNYDDSLEIYLSF